MAAVTTGAHHGGHLTSVPRSRNAQPPPRPYRRHRGRRPHRGPRRAPGRAGRRAAEPRLRVRARGAGGGEAGGRLSRRPHDRGNGRVGPHRPGRLGRAPRRRDAQPVRRPGHPAGRLLPRHLHVQHEPRLEPRRPVRHPPARALERRTRRRRPPGNRRQYANDFTISDWALAKGYAYAATDKGNSGTEFYKDGRRPGDAVAEWNDRVTQLTRAAKKVVAKRYGRTPRRTYAAGISNGGYLVRWQLENRPELYDGGIDAEGTLWRADGPNLFTYLPQVLRAYPSYAATGDPSAHKALLNAGLAPGSEFLWPFHDQVYWELTQRIYREEFDPAYTGEEASYTYATRPESVHRAVARVALTGRIRKPMITLHGTYDSLLPIGTDSDVYAKLVRAKGKAPYRYYRLEAANHVDGLYDSFPDRLRPLLPCMRTAFTALESWTQHGTTPPKSTTLPRPTSGDTVNTCSLS
ncbi:tannase/feruloyl esterase family alpha/beta hydrolase [Actinomadura luteofluorescens]|uniref:tannase/feruloyl esterase family alpha/beta hydrolase n=1 Tax=Actinomadura luteofluorescens TaxID=46163 RepID=UPI003642D338